MLKHKKQIKPEDVNELCDCIENMIRIRRIGKENPSVHEKGERANELADKLSLSRPYQAEDWSFNWYLFRSFGWDSERNSKVETKLQNCLTEAEILKCRLNKKAKVGGLRTQQRTDRESVRINNERFAVIFDGKESILGNTQKFKLIQLLVGAKGKCISHADILGKCIEQLSSDQILEQELLDTSEIEKVKQLKAQLCKDLRQSGLKELANAIKSTKGHYWLDL